MNKYEELWEEGHLSVESELQGIYRVIPKTGLIRFLQGDKKQLFGSYGFNIIWGYLRWGEFDIQYHEESVILKYKNERIVDQVRRIHDSGDLIGKFFLETRFLGWFRMVRE